MMRPLLLATIFFLVALATLTGCSDPTPTQDPTTSLGPTTAPSLTPAAPVQTETPQPVLTATTVPSAATTPLPANTQVPEATSEPTLAIAAPTPVPTQAPETPTTASTPASTPTKEPSIPASATATPGATPTGTAAKPTPSPTQVPSRATSTPAPEPTVAPPVLQEAVTLVITVAPIPAGIPEYNRSDWKHWVDVDGDCQDSRQEVLVQESLDEVTFETDEKCRVETGRWYGVFDGHDLGNVGYLDIDHMVPLKNAHLSGAWAWSPEKKEQYANYLEEPDHLIAVASRANRSKGARGPEEWKPRDEGYWCQYATDWAEIKERWSLTMTDPEAEAVVAMLGTCENPPLVEVWTALGRSTGEHKPEPTVEPESSVYGSCEDAEAAEEQRVQGSQGGGWGFPEATVPSARDGDGDGVVCEK